jgi:transcriptional regulator with XRE-family HTH domain
MEKVINNIRLLRKLNDFSQEYISTKLELSQSQYSRRENGTIQFSLPEIMKLASIFKIDYTSIIQNDVTSEYLESRKSMDTIDPKSTNMYDVMSDFIFNTIDLIIQTEIDSEKKQLLIENLKLRIDSLKV